MLLGIGLLALGGMQALARPIDVVEEVDPSLQVWPDEQKQQPSSWMDSPDVEEDNEDVARRGGKDDVKPPAPVPSPPTDDSLLNSHTTLIVMFLLDLIGLPIEIIVFVTRVAPYITKTRKAIALHRRRAAQQGQGGGGGRRRR